MHEAIISLSCVQPSSKHKRNRGSNYLSRVIINYASFDYDLLGKLINFCSQMPKSWAIFREMWPTKKPDLPFLCIKIMLHVHVLTRTKPNWHPSFFHRICDGKGSHHLLLMFHSSPPFLPLPGLKESSKCSHSISLSTTNSGLEVRVLVIKNIRWKACKYARYIWIMHNTNT